MHQSRDKLCYTVVLNATTNPQKLVWQAMHQDYSGQPVQKLNKTEADCGDSTVNRLLAGGKGHFGCFEHPQITFNCCYYPHDVISQARTHRIGVSFYCQSFRYTGRNLQDINTIGQLEKAIYIRPVGSYVSRSGGWYDYTEDMRENDLRLAKEAVEHYKTRIEQHNLAEEHARQMLPYSYRQHFVVSFNARSLMHFLDLRCKADAQLEIQWLADDLFHHFSEWMPEIANWYAKTRLRKAKLSP